MELSTLAMSVPASVSELESRGRLPGKAMMHAELACGSLDEAVM